MTFQISADGLCVCVYTYTYTYTQMKTRIYDVSMHFRTISGIIHIKILL